MAFLIESCLCDGDRIFIVRDNRSQVVKSSVNISVIGEFLVKAFSNSENIK